jgi:hypothetical protein
VDIKLLRIAEGSRTFNLRPAPGSLRGHAPRSFAGSDLSAATITIVPTGLTVRQ